MTLRLPSQSFGSSLLFLLSLSTLTQIKANQINQHPWCASCEPGTALDTGLTSEARGREKVEPTESRLRGMKKALALDRLPEATNPHSHPVRLSMENEDVKSSRCSSYHSLQPSRAEVKTGMGPRNSRMCPQSSYNIVQKRRFSGQGNQTASWVDSVGNDEPRRKMSSVPTLPLRQTHT